MREIFRFKYEAKKTLIRLVAEGKTFILEVTGDDGVRREITKDTDFDYVSEEYSCFIMAYINGLKQDQKKF